MPMKVVSLRRYPVKSMGGEPLDSVFCDERGLAGDRWFAVEDVDGRFASGKNTRRFRRRDAVFGYSAATDSTGEVTSAEFLESGGPETLRSISTSPGLWGSPCGSLPKQVLRIRTWEPSQ